MDLKTISLSAIGGAAIWEIVKQLISAAAKRVQDSQESKRKMLREDIENVVKLVCEILESSTGYYATQFGSEKAQELSRQIKAKSKTAGMKLAALNAQLSESKKTDVDVTLWTRFKSATTQHLDVRRTEIWHDDDPRLAEIYKAANHLHSSLSKARYSTV